MADSCRCSVISTVYCQEQPLTQPYTCTRMVRTSELLVSTKYRNTDT